MEGIKITQVSKNCVLLCDQSQSLTTSRPRNVYPESLLARKKKQGIKIPKFKKATKPKSGSGPRPVPALTPYVKADGKPFKPFADKIRPVIGLPSQTFPGIVQPQLLPGQDMVGSNIFFGASAVPRGDLLEVDLQNVVATYLQKFPVETFGDVLKTISNKPNLSFAWLKPTLTTEGYIFPTIQIKHPRQSDILQFINSPGVSKLYYTGSPFKLNLIEDDMPSLSAGLSATQLSTLVLAGMAAFASGQVNFLQDAANIARGVTRSGAIFRPTAVAEQAVTTAVEYVVGQAITQAPRALATIALEPVMGPLAPYGVSALEWGTKAVLGKAVAVLVQNTAASFTYWYVQSSENKIQYELLGFVNGKDSVDGVTTNAKDADTLIVFGNQVLESRRYDIPRLIDLIPQPILIEEMKTFIRNSGGSSNIIDYVVKEQIKSPTSTEIIKQNNNKFKALKEIDLFVALVMKAYAKKTLLDGYNNFFKLSNIAEAYPTLPNQTFYNASGVSFVPVEANTTVAPFKNIPYVPPKQGDVKVPQNISVTILPGIQQAEPLDTYGTFVANTTFGSSPPPPPPSPTPTPQTNPPSASASATATASPTPPPRGPDGPGGSGNTTNKTKGPGGPGGPGEPGFIGRVVTGLGLGAAAIGAAASALTGVFTVATGFMSYISSGAGLTAITAIAAKKGLSVKDYVESLPPEIFIMISFDENQQLYSLS